MNSEIQAGEELVDPEPFSLLLIVLGAAGSVASLASWSDDRSQRREREREANRFAVRDAIMGAETSLNELRGLVRSLEISFDTGNRRLSSADPASFSLAQFGRVSLVFTREGHERWREVEQDLLTAVGRIQRHMGDLMRHFATSQLRLPRDVAGRLQSAIERLNGIVGRLSQIHFAELFRALEEVVGECADVLRHLRLDLNDVLA